jgi:hypothetical protein
MMGKSPASAIFPEVATLQAIVRVTGWQTHSDEVTFLRQFAASSEIETARRFL